jgi:hypothetical protein
MQPEIYEEGNYEQGPMEDIEVGGKIKLRVF